MAMELKHLNPQHVMDVTGKAIDEISRLRAENAELKHKLEDAKATAYAESVDAGMRERRLKRALWLTRLKSLRNFSVLAYFQTIRAKGKKSNMDFDEMAYRINLACVKCRMKAEEYK